MAKQRLVIEGVKCVFDQETITIKKSYQVADEDAGHFCKMLKEKLPLTYHRTAKSWEKELIAHNYFYNKGMFLDHTVDTDLAEHEHLHRLVLYEVVYLRYRITSVASRIWKKVTN